MLASIQRIKSLSPIDKADKIEKAEVLGWQVVVEKGKYNVGDLIIYVEIDTILPEEEWSEFLRDKGFRIRTVKLRGQISQGIVFPLSILPQENYPVYEGMDVSTILNIKHYEKPIPVSLHGLVRGSFPSCVPKTDEEKIQNHPEFFDMLKDRMIYITTKCDGTSATFLLKNCDYHVCSRNLSLKPDVENIYWKMSEKYDIENKLRERGRNVAIQGELCGPSIQGNKIKLKEHDLFVFNVFDIDEYRYLEYDEFMMFCDEMGLKTVPVETIELFKYDLDSLIERAKGYYTMGSLKEGIVIRTVEGSPRISFKVLNNDSLLKNGE